MDNLRKRSERKKRDSRCNYSMEKFFRELLPVLDSLNNVFSVKLSKILHLLQDFKSITKGLSLIHKQFLSILENNGLNA